MHILQLLPRLDVGGVERGVLDVSRGLIARGHQVSVVSAGGALVSRLEAAGARHYPLPVDRKSPLSVWRCAPELARLIRETSVDIVHARSRMPAWSGWLAARRTGRVFLTTCHGFYRPHPASRVMTWGRDIIVPSQALGRYLIDRFGVPPERLRVIPRGVELSEFPFRPPEACHAGPWTIGLIGRLSAIKGHEVALRALHQLISRRLDARMRFIGEPPQDRPQIRGRLDALAQELGVADRLEWLGRREDIAACLSGCDLAVVPSVYPESFGRSVIEAQAVGVPVVASRIGAIPEIIEDGATGLLTAPGDATELAAALARCMTDEALRVRMIEAARRRVEERFAAPRMVDETLRVYDDARIRPRIVVWKLGAAGDVVLASPSLRSIRRAFPRGAITLITGRSVVEVARHCPHVDEVRVFDARGRHRRPASAGRFVRELARGAFDLSIDLQNSRLTHGLAWAGCVRRRIGYARRWARLLTDAVELPKTPMPPVAHQAVLLQAAGVALEDQRLEVWPSDEDEARADALLRAAGVDAARPLIGVHPGASARWATKRWDVERWAAVCDRMAEQGGQIIITGGPDEHALEERLRRLMRARPAGLVGQTSLMALACVIRRCRLFLTHDSVPLHLASAVGTPTVALFGPTDPARHVQPSATLRVLMRDVFCSPCYSPRCLTITHACMKKITVDDVVSAAEELLQIKNLKF